MTEFDPIIDVAMNQQIAVADRVTSIRNDLADLMTIRLNPETAGLLIGEEQNLSSALTALQMLLSHMQGGKPMLRVVQS